ncbi:MAG: VOC family protein [Saprospiraceae bacterium]
MTSSENSLNWFEISIKDVARAKKFYEKIFGIKMQEMEMMGSQMVFFPSEPGSGKANGALVKSKMHKPAKSGAKIYLNANPNLTKVLSKVEKAGGKVTMPKTKIGEFGNMAFFEDTEGNSVALHSNK